MLALVKTAPGPGLSLETVPDPAFGINDVVIRVRKTGICGTDLHIESWDAWAAKNIETPLVVGHEFVGEIVEVGSNVYDFHAGDLVSGEGHVVCGVCRHCLAGRRHLCAHTIGLGVGRDGAFAEYVVMPVTNIWHHAARIDEEVAAIFDPFGNAVHTALSFPVLGEDVLVSGAGPIGLMATAVVRHAGARHVVVSEPNAFRRELAMRMGATIAIDPRERDLRDVMTELGMVEGYDVVLEMSGNPKALRDALGVMAHGGNMAVLGIPTEEVALDLNEIVFKMLTVRGIYGREMYETWYKMTVMLQSASTSGRRSRTASVSGTSRPHSPPLARANRARSSWTGSMMDRATHPDPLAFLGDELEALRERNLYRPAARDELGPGPIVSVDGQRVISLSSNDYLGLTHHPRLREAVLDAVRDFGVGSGAVRTIAGTMTMHQELEAELAAFKGTEAVLTFQSGFTANTGVIPTITGETDLIVSDALNHASIIDGMRLSKAPRKVYPHADVDALREVLREAVAGGGTAPVSRTA
jgi:threonine 3-dehydrogenase